MAFRLDIWLPNNGVTKFAFAALIMFATATSAQEWVYLGGSPPVVLEIDLDSIAHRNGHVQAHIRAIADRSEGRLFMHQILTIDCTGSRARIADGWITSDYSPRVAPMPDLPENQRVLIFPTLNEALNVMFDYVCRRS